MADRQFVIGGVEPAPAAWDIPASLQLIPKTARASFDGSGAAGSFKPCLRIVSDSGHVVLESVTAETVAAGGSADVSWFQGVRQAGAGAAAAGAIPAGYKVRTTTHTLAVGSNHKMLFGAGTLITNDSTVMSSPDNFTIRLAHGGLVVAGLVGTFGTDGGVPYTGQFEMQTEILDAGSFAVDQLMGPDVYASELYATDPGDTFLPNGYSVWNCDDSSFTPPYDLTGSITNLTAVTFIGYAMFVCILDPTGLT